MANLPTIDDSNTFADKIDNRVIAAPDNLKIRAQDLNRLRDRISENRAAINAGPVRLHDMSTSGDIVPTAADHGGLILAFGAAGNLSLDDTIPNGVQFKVLVFFGSIADVIPTGAGTVLGSTQFNDGDMIDVTHLDDPLFGGSTWAISLVQDQAAISHVAATSSNPHGVTASMVGAVPSPRTITFSTSSITLDSAFYADKLLRLFNSGTSIVTVGQNAPPGSRYLIVIDDPGRKITLATSGTMTLIGAPGGTIEGVGTTVILEVHNSAQCFVRVYRQEIGIGVEDTFIVNDTLEARHHNRTIVIDNDTRVGTMSVTVPDTLPDGFRTRLRILDNNAHGGINSFVPQGSLVLYWLGGGLRGMTHGEIVEVYKESATRCYLRAIAPTPLEPVLSLSSNTTLTDAHSGKTLFANSNGGIRTLTIDVANISDGWHCRVVREGANNVVVAGSSALYGPASSGGSVTISTDSVGVEFVRRSASAVWAQ